MKLVKLIDRLIKIQGIKRVFPAVDLEVDILIDLPDQQLQFPLRDIAVSAKNKKVILIYEKDRS